jgi:WD40 repeat protein
LNEPLGAGSQFAVPCSGSVADMCKSTEPSELNASSSRSPIAKRLIALGTGKPSSSYVVRVNTHTGSTRSLIAPQPKASNLAATSVIDLAWSPDGQNVAVVEGNGEVIVVDPGGRILMDGSSLGAESLQFLLGGSVLIGVDAQGTANLWDIATGSILSTFPVERFAPPGSVGRFPDLRGGTSLAPIGSSRMLVTDPGAYPAIFNFGLRTLLDDACRTAGRQLEEAEVQRIAAPAPPEAWSCN